MAAEGSHAARACGHSGPSLPDAAAISAAMRAIVASVQRALRRREVQPLAEVNSGHAPQAPALQGKFIWAMWQVGMRTRLSFQPFRSHGAALCCPCQRASDTPPRKMRSHALSRRALVCRGVRGRGLFVVVRGHVRVSRAWCLHACLPGVRSIGASRPRPGATRIPERVGLRHAY